MSVSVSTVLSIFLCRSDDKSTQEFQMPPVRLRRPKRVYVRVPKATVFAQKEPEIRIGKTLVAAGPRALQQKHYRMVKRVLDIAYGKRQQNIIDFCPTRAQTRRTPETKMGCGKGKIADFLALVPAGKIMVQIPNIVSFQNFGVQHNTAVLNHLAGILPNRCRVRSQFNFFKENGLKEMQENKQREEGKLKFERMKEALQAPRYLRKQHRHF